MNKFLKLRKFFAITFCILLVVTCGFIGLDQVKANTSGEIEKYNVLSYNSTGKEDIIYLSDIPYQSAKIGWKTIGLDKTNDNAALVMNINGAAVVVKKGIWAHATSEVIYDISNYKDYAYFTTYYGLNTSAGNTGNGVKFYIYTSQDGETWTLQTEENPTPLKGVNNAIRVKIDIRDTNYIKLYAHDNGSNASDHAVWGDAKLVKEGYSDNVMMTVEEYDKIIKEHYQSGPVEGNLRLVLLQRNFIKNVGQYQLRNFLESDPKHYETLDWFLNNEEALRLWTIGGKPNGSYERSLQVLSKLYHTYKEDLSNENVTALGTKYKDLYLKMMLSLSLTHSTNVGLWIGGNHLSDAVTRYNIYKQMHLNGQLADNAMFESYTIDEMRGVMITNIDDEEILWLRDYSTKYKTTAERFNPYKYINYTFNYGYYRPQYYSQENYAMWDQKYNLSKYNITYQSGKPKLWIVFEEGSVCGGLSKTAANLYGVWGYPARVVGQPGHAAYVYLYNAGGGKYAWQLANSASSTGWTNTTGGGYNGWGSKYSISNNTISTGSYLLLSQEAQNEYEKYERAELILLLEDVYKNDTKKLEQIYRDALKEEIINLDAWIGLVNLYITDSSKTEAELIELADEIAEVYTYHPLPMYDLTRRIGSKITSLEYHSRMMMLQDKTLRKAAKATSKETIYYREVPVIANALLGIVDSRVATFSFDGANAGKIVLSKQLQSAQVSWTYSLDGGETWKDVFEHSVQLTKEEIDSIDINNDIKIHITGLPMTEANIYTIDITRGTFPNGVITIDDEEDRMFGATAKMEWTFDLNGEWNSFANTNPVFNGNKRVYVRLMASGTQIASNPVYYTFTENNSDDTKWYIQSKNLEVVEVNGTGAGNYKTNILDGNENTYWRSKAGSMPAYVTIKLDQPRYISGLDFKPDKSYKDSLGFPCGKAQNINIYVSMDGQNWELVVSKNNIGENDNLKHFDFTPKKAQYVKLECTKVYRGPGPKFMNSFTVSFIKLYENVLVNETPRAEVNYNITRPTNQNVTAELINITKPITVTNNDNKTTYTFTENGEFTFEFEDEEGNKGTATAVVDWIDKEPPTVEVNFSTTEITNENVVATLSFNKNNITILSTDVQVSENPVDKSKTITFLENDTFELKFADELGNIGTKTITVDWIDTEAPTAEFEFSTTSLTDGKVIATLKPSEEIIITNNDGKDTYIFDKNGSFTFEFVDKAGNTGSATVIVNWIARLPKYEIKYSTTTLTNQDVKVVLELEEGYRIFNNNANKEYIFTKNGTFSFQYKDEYGIDGFIPITVDWIDKEEPTATFEYSTKELTNDPVVVTLKPSEEVTITNNDGKDTYTFIENGEFTFEFVDKAGNNGFATVTVDWIDKEEPIATFEYSTKEPTNDPVVVTLKPSEEVTITNNDGKDTYTFIENGEFTFEFVDKAGNIGFATVTVDWINKEAPTATIEYSTKEPTSDPVVVTLKSSEKITIINNNGKDTYTFTDNGSFTFEFIDQAGNTESATVTVDWIDKEEPTATFEYSTKEPTNDPVVVTLKPSEEVTITNNDGKDTYTFIENGEFTFEFVDKAGNIGFATVTVDWIEKKQNNSSEDNTDTIIKPDEKNDNNSENNMNTITNPNDRPMMPENIYIDMSAGNLTIKVPNSILSKYDNASLDYQKLALSNEQKTIYGENSEIYEVSLKTEDNKKINLSNIILIQIVKLSTNKEFDAIYAIRADGNIVKLDSKVNANNEVVFEDNGLGKYIVSYKSVASNNEEKKDNIKRKINYIPYILVGIAILLMGGATYFIIIKKK